LTLAQHEHYWNVLYMLIIDNFYYQNGLQSNIR